MSRSVKWRKILLVLGVVLAVGAVGGAVTLLLTYHEATKIDRSNPKVVAAEYLRALFVNDDEVGADLYSCSSRGALAPLTMLQQEIQEREKKFDVEVLVTWGAMDRADQDDAALLSLDLVISGTKDGAVTSERSERWQIKVVDDDGWRVCGAEKVAAPTAAPSAQP